MTNLLELKDTFFNKGVNNEIKFIDNKLNNSESDTDSGDEYEISMIDRLKKTLVEIRKPKKKDSKLEAIIKKGNESDTHEGSESGTYGKTNENESKTECFPCDIITPHSAAADIYKSIDSIV